MSSDSHNEPRPNATVSCIADFFFLRLPIDDFVLFLRVEDDFGFSRRGHICFLHCDLLYVTFIVPLASKTSKHSWSGVSARQAQAAHNPPDVLQRDESLNHHRTDDAANDTTCLWSIINGIHGRRERSCRFWFRQPQSELILSASLATG